MDTLIKNKAHKMKITFYRGIRFIYEKFVKPKSESEDGKRREFILNIFLLCLIVLFSLGLIVIFYQYITMPDFKGISPPLLSFFFLIFLFLYIISRLGFFNISSYIFIGLLLLITTFSVYKWSVELPSSLLFYTLTIIMSSVLISTRFAFIITSIVSFTVAIIGYLQIQNIILADTLWKNEAFGFFELITYILIFIIIATISWLSNRELERSLKRASKSEAELKKERDLLEIRVEERTKDLKNAQMDQIKEVSRLAEFGRLSSGLFHDLVNPLTALYFNIGKIRQFQDQYHRPKEFKEVDEYLNKTLRVVERMREFTRSIQRQIDHEDNKTLFSVNQEINEAVQVLAYRANKNNIKINTKLENEVQLIGDPVRFNQIILNLISNAIDAYPLNDYSKCVDINLFKEKGKIVLRVKDYGKGIPEEIQNKIFEAFFTTKKDGTGIGLSLVKNIAERDFKGRIKLKSIENQGTTFIIKFYQNLYDYQSFNKTKL